MPELLQEFNLFEYKPVTDEKYAGDMEKGKVLMSGLMQRANAENQNGRVYPKDVLGREVDKFQTFIEENRALGELDHPDNAVVNLANASHLVRDLWWEAWEVQHVIQTEKTSYQTIFN